MLKENILSKAVVNKVNYNGESYLRVYNIDEQEENKGNLINLKLFHEINPNVYLPLFYEEGLDKDLFARLMTTDINEDIIIDLNEIEMFLLSLNLYIENTYDVVKSSVESLMPGYEMIVYKEYMSVFYTVLVSDKDAYIYEVKIDKTGKISLLYLEDNMADIIISRDFSRYVNEDVEMYINVSENRYIVIATVSGKQCFMDINIPEKDVYNLKSIKFSEASSDNDVSLALDTVREKFNYIIELESNKIKDKQ